MICTYDINKDPQSEGTDSILLDGCKHSTVLVIIQFHACRTYFASQKAPAIPLRPTYLRETCTAFFLPKTYQHIQQYCLYCFGEPIKVCGRPRFVCNSILLVRAAVILHACSDLYLDTSYILIETSRAIAVSQTYES